MLEICPICCSMCAASSSRSQAASHMHHAFSLENLLAAGTISLHPHLIPECDHAHWDDGWHNLQNVDLIKYVDSDDASLCRLLEFLISNHFILATYQQDFTGDTLVLRIYVVPWDLPGMRGRLRMRPEAVLNVAREYIPELFSRIVQDPETWEGRACSPYPQALISWNDVEKTMAELYSDLPSPMVTTEDIPISHLRDIGLRSNLYGYQHETVAAMMEKELGSQNIADPLFTPIESVDGKTFYFQPSTCEVLQTRPMFSSARGGILCEELGTGKTIMILTLILATLHQLPSPEESVVDPRLVMTPLAFRHFPSPVFVAARERARVSKSSAPFPRGPRVPSLVELLLHHNRLSPTNIYHWEDRLEHSNNLTLHRANIPFYHHYSEEPINESRTRQKPLVNSPRTMYLSTATLIVVPSNLIEQWSREALKHFWYSLRVLRLRQTTKMPSIKSLASDYDIVLMTYDRFSAEYAKRDILQLHTWNFCTCPEYPNSRVPNCQCPDNTEVSALLQIRWKRLVLDEGHVSGTMEPLLNHMAKLMSVERKWIVTGTPTRNLLGLSFGKNSKSTGGSGKDPGTAEQPDTPEEIREVTPSHLLPETVKTRVWSVYDRDDLRRLNTMVTHFVAVPQFAANSGLFMSSIIEPLCNSKGPRLGSIQVLKQVMQMIMIRHRIEDVEKDVVLPAVKQEIILLDLDEHAVKSYNALQAGVVINAVDSERKDQDYLLHPKNVAALLQTVTNLSQLLFWRIDDGLYNVDEMLRSMEEHIEKAVSRGASDHDLRLLQEASMHIQSAAEDMLWRKLQTDEHMPYRVYGMDSTVFDAWSRIPASGAKVNTTLNGFIQSDRLREIIKTVTSRPKMSYERLIELAVITEERDIAVRRPLAKLKGKKGAEAKRRPKSHIDPSVGRDMDQEVIRELEKAQARIKALADGDSDGMPDDGGQDGFPASTLLASSPFAHVRIGNSGSTKLDYILNDVAQYWKEEKFLIFSQSTLTLEYIADGLDLAHIKYLRLTAGSTAVIREQYVMTFETSDTYPVFLMELKHGARGLNLITASRVIFCEPVWQADVESQAIKRVHRIGQTKPVSVKTLAIRGTAEENMMARRNALKRSTNNVSNITNDQGMRDYIANPQFITHPPMRVSTLDIPLIPLPQQTSADVAQQVHVSVALEAAVSKPLTSPGSAQDGLPTPSPKKKRKVVTFFRISQ